MLTAVALAIGACVLTLFGLLLLRRRKNRAYHNVLIPVAAAYLVVPGVVGESDSWRIKN